MTSDHPGEGLDPEDAKLVNLARGARARVSASGGAAIRDETGRTYAAADVRLVSLSLSALELAVAQAVASGARGAEAAVVVMGSSADVAVPEGLAALRELGGAGVPVLMCDGSGAVVTRTTT